MRRVAAIVVVCIAFAVPATANTIVILSRHAEVLPGDDLNNFSILTLSNGQTSAMRLLYSAKCAATARSSKAAERKRIVEISFVKSGGIAGPMTRVQGTVHFNHDVAEVTGDAAYSRQLAPDETEMLRAGANPDSLKQTATQLAKRSSSGGAADIEHYTITVKTADGKTHNISLNSTGGAEAGVSPAAAKFLSWLQKESQSILQAKMQSR